MTRPPPDWINISQFAHIYGVDRGTVYKWLKSGLLEHYKLGWVTRIRNLPPPQHRLLKSVETVTQALPSTTVTRHTAH